MKKQYLIKAIVLTIIMIFALFSLTGVLAQVDQPSETFDDQSLPGWERSEGAVVQNGVLLIQPGNFAVNFGGQFQGDMRLRLKQTTPGVIFIRYAMGEQGEYNLILHEDMLVLEKVVQDNPTVIGESPRSAPTGEWQTIEISLKEGVHQIALDEQILITVNEDESLQGGGLGFWVEGENAAEFDDLILQAGLGGEDKGGLPAEPMEEATVLPTDSATTTSGRLSINDLINELSSTQANPTQISTFVVNLLLSVVLSYILSRVYVHWGSSLSNRRRFAANFILISVTTTFIILVVRSSVALSLGLVGALSIVRFRSAIKEPEELAYLFFAISIGIGLGDNQRLITVIALAVAILVLGGMRLFRGRQADFNLHVSIASFEAPTVELETILETLSMHSAQYKLMRFDDAKRGLEASFLVEFRNLEQLKQAKAALRSLSDSLEITFLDNKGIW